LYCNQHEAASKLTVGWDVVLPNPAAVEHKIETLVAAPAAVEEALASLIVDNQDKYHALQYRALVTYIKRVYHPFLMCEPQVRAGCMSVVVLYYVPASVNAQQVMLFFRLECGMKVGCVLAPRRRRSTRLAAC
jgi:hypothetical protein